MAAALAEALYVVVDEDGTEVEFVVVSTRVIDTGRVVDGQAVVTLEVTAELA